MTAPRPLDQLGRRERQIVEILFARGRATAAEVQEALGEPVSNSAVRGMLRLLTEKGYVTFEQDGPRYVYMPVDRPEEVSRSALRHLVATFFRSSPSSAMAALLDMADAPLTDDEYRRMARLLERAREGGEGA
ncbi:BlaI/MecI/CopY family transcriptional regulator [Roseisolibacter sp. H3M3-2]|uniref:BlaI/MecI/CopY family transcriptional regulator n=1 Tax=Roseisolibacter sp. H3M3-2 TaxID=3031323 RepID=UPI0023DBE633|nr:BlaI/MecI/CopY family transcriptional regulator [Roseisolibacter sp. H3M3-2]MDF1504874.1 BlaI/MecI/CopY family transcriptional regulator [Roseisolibacter sp. H3M3-2]